MADSVYEKVLANFDNGPLLCAETVLKLIVEMGGRDPAPLLGMASGFCSGIARSKGQCGALTGAIMGIGLFAGEDDPSANREKVYDLTLELMDRFTEQFGSCNCFDLTGCDFQILEDKKRFQESVKQKCFGLCAFAVDTAMELLEDAGVLPDRKTFIRARLAPCGLSCGHCLAFAEGPIREAAVRLRDGLGPNFAPYAERFAAMNPVFKDYEGFKGILDFLTKGSCGGCREQGCLFQTCKVPACTREHQADYCFECDEFPCDKHGMPGGLAERWKANNEKMAEIGVEAWFARCGERPRYP